LYGLCPHSIHIAITTFYFINHPPFLPLFHPRFCRNNAPIFAAITLQSLLHCINSNHHQFTSILPPTSIIQPTYFHSHFNPASFRYCPRHLLTPLHLLRLSSASFNIPELQQLQNFQFSPYHPEETWQELTRKNHLGMSNSRDLRLSKALQNPQ